MAENISSSFEDIKYLNDIHGGKFRDFEFSFIHDFDSFSEVNLFLTLVDIVVYDFRDLHDSFLCLIASFLHVYSMSNNYWHLELCQYFNNC